MGPEVRRWGRKTPRGGQRAGERWGENELDGSLEHLAQLFMLNMRKVTRELN